MIVWLRKVAGFWTSFVALTLLTYVSPLLGLVLGFSEPRLVTGWVLLGSVVLGLFLVEWAKARWARRFLKELQTGHPAGVGFIVRVNELGRWQVKTLVLTLGPLELTLRSQATTSKIPLAAITGVTVANYGPFRTDSVQVETNLFGPIELVPLRSDGVAPVGDEEATQLAASISELKNGC